jgi:hypothetical protein|tara:strand:- start:4325 stop:4741 length:417 start_codon:yes stop_codon:yes gene_type:complete
MDIEHILTSLENENNESIMKLTSAKISKHKNDILQKLQLERNELKEMNKKLKHYRYVDEISDIQYGCYIRWISLKNPNSIKLTNGGLICDIIINDDDVNIRCKNNFNRFMEIKMNENVVFQKLTDQERTLLGALDYLS